MTFISYAQNFEDVLLWRALRSVENGCYIDVGAGDPDEDSVTRAFYDAGWRGVNVEPMETFTEQLHLRRPGDVNLSVAAGAESGERVFYQIWSQPDEMGRRKATGLSTLNLALAQQAGRAGREVQETKTRVTTLAAICSTHVQGTIHFLKVDAEGSEHEVLLGADFISFRPWVIVVEAIRPDTLLPNHREWESILLAADYRFVWFDGLNRFYVAAEQFAALAPKFRTPVNVFDDIVRDDPGATARLTEAHAAFTAEQAETARLRNQLERVTSDRDQAIAANEKQSLEFRRLVKTYERRLAESAIQINSLNTLLMTAESEVEALKRSLTRTVGYLDRLVLELRWEHAPRALKAVLPFARLIRKSNELLGSKPKHAAVMLATDHAMISSASVDVPSERALATPSVPDTYTELTPRKLRWGRRFLVLPYYAFRPIVRPLAWRLRTFLTTETLSELRQLREDQRALAEQQSEVQRSLAEQRSEVQRALAEQQSAVELNGFSEAADRLLLTLALEHRGEPYGATDAPVSSSQPPRSLRR